MKTYKQFLTEGEETFRSYEAWVNRTIELDLTRKKFGKLYKCYKDGNQVGKFSMKDQHGTILT